MKEKLVSLAKRGWVLPVICALVLSITVGVVIAATMFRLDVPSQSNVNPYVPPGGGGGTGGSPSNSIQVFYDEGLTNQVVLPGPITYPNVTQFGNTTKTFWVKNTGTATVDVSVAGVTLPAGVTLTAPAITGLAAGANQSVVVTLAADGTASAGPLTFTTRFESAGP